MIKMNNDHMKENYPAGGQGRAGDCKCAKNTLREVTWTFNYVNVIRDITEMITPRGNVMMESWSL